MANVKVLTDELQKLMNNKMTDEMRLDWLQQMMTSDTSYCEIFFAGLRDFKSGNANAFQVESNPQKFETVNAPTLREAIDLAFDNYCETQLKKI